MTTAEVLGTLTPTQVEAVADALGLDPARLLMSIAEAFARP
ncbi:hypothetical protein [Nocardioides sp. MH1]